MFQRSAKEKLAISLCFREVQKKSWQLVDVSEKRKRKVGN
jgi:hypothetical protein